MVVFKRKNRVLTLRISDEDYQILQEASVRDGARSLSDYARDSLLGESRAAALVTASDLKTRMDEFAVEIDSLSRALRHLRGLIATKPNATQ